MHLLNAGVTYLPSSPRGRARWRHLRFPVRLHSCVKKPTTPPVSQGPGPGRALCVRPQARLLSSAEPRSQPPRYQRSFLLSDSCLPLACVRPPCSVPRGYPPPETLVLTPWGPIPQQRPTPPPQDPEASLTPSVTASCRVWAGG